MKTVLLLTASLLLFGCHSAAKAPQVKSSQAKNDLAAKLQTMTPAERADYFKQHPDEVRAALTFGK